MAIVSKHISWTGATREELTNYLSKANVEINITWISDTEANIVGDSADLQTYRTFLATKGITVTVLGDGPPIPAPEPDPPIPSGTPLDNDKWQQATQAIRDEDRLAKEARVNAKYDSLGGTREP